MSNHGQETAVTRPSSQDRAEELLLLLEQARASGLSKQLREAERNLVLYFHGFACSCAHRFAARGVDLDDLLQIADVGLVKAVQGWRPQPAGGFLQYAKPMIIGELKRYFRDHVSPIRVPRRLQEVGAAVAMARRDLHHLGHEPTDREIADCAGLTVKEVRADAAARATSNVDSLDENPDGYRCAANAVPDPSSAAETRMMLREAIGTLEAREQRLLAMRYFQDCTQQQIGDTLGVSQMQVSRLLRKALRKLQHQLVA